MVRWVQARALDAIADNKDATLIPNILRKNENDLYTQEDLDQYLDAVTKTGGDFKKGKMRSTKFVRVYFNDQEYYLHPRDAFVAKIYLVYEHLHGRVCYLLLLLFAFFLLWHSTDPIFEQLSRVPEAVRNVLAHFDGRIKKQQRNLGAGHGTNNGKKRKKHGQDESGDFLGLEKKKSKQAKRRKGVDPQEAV